MHRHHPTTAQWEPQESDLMAANGLYRRENNMQGAGGSTYPNQPPLSAHVMQANQDAGLFAGHPQEGVTEKVGVRKPSFLP